MYRKTQLDNGLKIITHNMPKMQSVALGIWIKVGGRCESKEIKGIAHYLEHILFKGSKKYSCRKIKESIEGVGGSLNGFTSEELTCYLAKLPSRYLNLALDILSDMVINPILLSDEVEKERTVILEEIKMHKDQPSSFVHELLDELLWPNQPLGESIIGTYQTISRIKRDQIALFHKHHYAPPHIVISVAGLLEHKDVVKKAERIFLRLRDKKINTFPLALENQRKPQLRILHKKTETAHLALGFHSFKRDHPLRHAIGLMHVILGANMSSRLFNELREKRGLVYEIGTQVKRFQDTGAFLISAGIDNNKVIEAINLILKELSKIKYKLVTDDEFKRAKVYYLGQLTLALEDTLDHMLWIGETTATLDKTYSLEEIIKEVSGLEREHILQVARNIFKEENLNLALIAPLRNSKAKLYKQLRID